MDKRFLALVVIELFIAVALTAALSTDDLDQESAILQGETSLQVMQDTIQDTNVSEIDQMQLLTRSWNQYVEDLNYSSDLLSEFVQKNISQEQALILTTSVLVLNTKTLEDLEVITPEEKYRDFFNYTLEGIRFFNSYLWNMGKFFESSDGIYVLVARENFNVSQEYYALGRDELEFLA